ncbi:hypothetical protein D9M68_520000 [compost metagenome]
MFCTKNIRPKPTIRLRASNTSTFGARAATCRKHSQCTAMPSAISSAKATGMNSSGEMPSAVCAHHVRKAPSIRNSPCEMFMMRISPYCRFSPMATSA